MDQRISVSIQTYLKKLFFFLPMGIHFSYGQYYNKLYEFLSLTHIRKEIHLCVCVYV